MDSSAEQIEETVRLWGRLFETGDVAGLCRLYSEQGVLQGTLSAVYRNTPELIKEYFVNATKHQSKCVTFDTINVSLLGESAVASGNYRFCWSDHQAEVVIDARYTLVLQLNSGQWQIIEHHSSVRPK